MTRLLLLGLAAPLFLGAAEAQTPAAPVAKPDAAKVQAEGTAPAPAPTQAEIDRQIQEAVQREVAKVKEQLRDEVRAEIQGAQSAAEFLGEQEEKKKLQFLELNGYFRFRWDLFNNMNLGLPADPAGWYLWLGNSTAYDHNGTQTSGNMKLRVDSTFNISEQVRIRATLDFLNVVFGSTPIGPNYNNLDYFAQGQLSPTSGKDWYTNAVEVQRVWGEVQTPVGLLSFGRMPAQWGAGIYENAGDGLDSDYGDNVDRIQFAIPITMVLGGLAIIPYYDWYSAGLLYSSMPAGIGQPLNVTDADDVGAIGIRLVREDTADQQKRKLDKGLASINYGLLFNYKSQRIGWTTLSLQQPLSSSVAQINRSANAGTLDLFGRFVLKRFLFEAEAVGVFGSIGNASFNSDPTQSVGPESIRQFGGVVKAVGKLGETGKVAIGGEFGAASPGNGPGFGVYPGRSCDYTKVPVTCTVYPGTFDGQQYSPVAGTSGSINNYRFNPAYQVDLILWHELIGTVTNGWYLKPTFKWDILEGLNVWAQVLYSQAFNAQATPSMKNKPLGVELDLGVKYQSDDGFVFFLSYGLLKPLSAFDVTTTSSGVSSVVSPSGVAQYLHSGLGIVY
ncbi:MAG TPA: TIGR04551 family protein [Anaeromyxobacteraceae bacterium]|nr:TIGR04551 family protein [Anaeromyxobacteraceae bacterium]